MSGRANDPRDFWSSVTASRLSDLGLLSPSFDASSEDIHRQALDDEIAAMSAALSGLKERRNFFHSKLKFPPEVLEHIFAHAALNEVPGQGRTEAVKTLGSVNTRAMESKVYEILGWVKLTHVCRAWRAIAFADGNSWLWSTMDTARLSKAGMREILSRSHSQPITPKITLSMDIGEMEMFETLLEPEYLSRLKSLQIVADERIHPGTLTGEESMFDHAHEILCMLNDDNLPAPGLMIESLAVAYDDSSDFLFSLPYRLLAPHLRHLTLKNVRLSLNDDTDTDVVTYPQLTHLDIIVDPQKDTDNYIDELLDFLRGSPNLQVLHLLGSLLSVKHITSLDEENIEALRVDLLHLEELRLDGTYHECSWFGEYLNLPDTCAITIDTVYRQLTVEPDKLRPLLRRWAQSPVRLDIYSWYIRSIRVWNTAVEPNTDKLGEGGRILMDKPPRLHLMMRRFLDDDLYDSGPSQPVPLKATCWDMLLHGVIFYKGLTDLRVCSDDGSMHCPLWWRKLFQEARAVQHMSIECAEVESCLLSALNPAVSHLDGKHLGEPLFPDLKTLHICCYNPAAFSVRDLQSCLQARRDNGLSTVIEIELDCSNRSPPAAFKAFPAELEGLATFHIKADA